MELFEVLRREYAAGETILGLARKHGVHRRMVRQAIASASHRRGKRATGLSPNWARCESTSIGCWNPIARRSASSGTLRIECGCDCGPSIRSKRSRNRRCAAACGSANVSSVWPGRKSSGRRAITGARKRKSIGTKPRSESTAKGRSCTSSRCAAWRRATRSIESIGLLRSKRCWRPTRRPSITSAGCFATEVGERARRYPGVLFGARVKGSLKVSRRRPARMPARKPGGSPHGRGLTGCSFSAGLRGVAGGLFGGSGARVVEGFEKKAGTNAGPQAWWLAPRKTVDWMFLLGGIAGRCGRPFRRLGWDRAQRTVAERGGPVWAPAPLGSISRRWGRCGSYSSQ